MNSDRWQRIQHLVEEALEQPEAARRSFIESACGEEVDLRDEVMSLLAAPVVDELPTAWLAALARPEPARFVAGERVAGRYLIRALLGRGGMGEVYEAQDEELAITVALKTLRLTIAEDAALQGLKLEGLLARAVWHPNVCRVYDLGRHGEGSATVWFLTMERLHGATLAQRLRDETRLPLDRALRLTEQMAAGLGAAHQAGVVHRDFKPGNVMLVGMDGGEQAVVTDFGTARAAARTDLVDPRGGSAPIIGTAAYMAPEQVRGEEVGPAADLYALGVVIYEMVTGALPFSGGSSLEVARRRLEEDAPSARSVVPEIDPHWDAVIQRCLAREPRHRFERAEDVAAALAGRMPATAVETVTPRSRHTLPAERDPFVGRQTEIEELERSLAGGSRLVTLLGAGGMGKTRLAVRHGWQSLGAWSGGVLFCDLTEARTVNGIASAVAGSLGIPIGRGDPVEQLGHAITGRGRCLLILDNFEQVTDHADETVGRWLKQAPEARWVVTSRERLNLDGERVQTIEPLSIETGVELFTARARGLRPALDLVGTEAEAAREIVRLVDGMPLAIELAAARIRVMSVAQILEQMRKRFRLLTGGRDARHETLEGAIDGSWELLLPWERAAWAQCSVFEAGFTLEAAERVLNLGPWPEAPWVVDVMQSLVDKSLLRAWVPRMEPGEGAPDARLGMYVSLREYARLKLQDGAIGNGGGESGAALAAEERHGRYYARYGTQEQIDGLDRHGGVGRRHALGRELENLVAACQRALSRGDSETAVATYRAASHVLILRGPLEVVVKLGRNVLAQISDPGHQARVFFLLGWAELFLGREEAQRHLEAALTIDRELGDRANEGIVCGTLAILLMNQGRMKEARAHFEHELAIDRELGNRVREGIVLLNLGECHRKQGQMEEARTHFEGALAVCREVGNRRVEGMLLLNLGQLHRRQGRKGEARAHVEAALALSREVGNRLSEGTALNSLGLVYFEQGDLEEADTHFRAALTLHRETGNRIAEGLAIGNLGQLHFVQGHLEKARSQYEAALAIFRELGNPFGESEALDALGALHLRQGKLEEAREALDQGEAVARRVGGSLELGKLLCSRAELEQQSGNQAAAWACLEEAQAIVIKVGSGPDSELGRVLAKARQALGVQA